jgi:predicted helicase
MGDWITGLIEAYKYVDGQPFGEKKHWLQDDYVKFLRFAQWKIAQAGRGVVGMITNHGYLDNPTFRGMRQSLTRTFDDIYVLDLHGNALKKETGPDGSPDKNVFDIRQGVAIAFFVKRGGKTKSNAVVRHAELYGLRETKYAWMNEHDQRRTRWREIAPSAPFYLFVPHKQKGCARYRSFAPMNEVFPVNVTGIVTARDGFVLDFDKSALLRRIGQFRDRSLTDEFVRQAYKLKDTRGWQLAARRKDLAKLEDWRDYVVPCLYRPFDTRSLYYHPYMVDWGRPEVMRHMLARENLALLLPQRVEHMGAWQHAFTTTSISEHVAVSLKTIDYHFPLYLDAEPERSEKTKPGIGQYVSMMLFEPQTPYRGKRPNLNPALVVALTAACGKAPTPEAIFHYIYAVLYAPAYRTKYAEFLKMDFPRIPFTADAKLFKKMAALGEKLVALHLLQSPDLDPPACRFEGEGNNRVEKDRQTGLRYDADEERVYINAAQHFAPVPEAVWSYQVGGYQVCEKWLKDRKERRLELDDLRAYCRIVTALERTIERQQQIDALYSEAESHTVPMTQKEPEIQTDSPTTASSATARKSRRDEGGGASAIRCITSNARVRCPAFRRHSG